MAIDTETKRRAVARLLPVADGSIDQYDRRQVAGVYPFGAAPAATGIKMDLCANLYFDTGGVTIIRL